MPTITGRVSAVTSDALANKKFNVIPESGAILNVWAAGATKDDAIGVSVGDRDIAVQGTIINIESSADVIDVNRDQVIFNEVVGGGQLFLPVSAVTTELAYLIHLRYL